MHEADTLTPRHPHASNPPDAFTKDLHQGLPRAVLASSRPEPSRSSETTRPDPSRPEPIRSSEPTLRAGHSSPTVTKVTQERSPGCNTSVL